MKKKGILVYNSSLFADKYLQQLELYVSGGESVGIELAIYGNRDLYGGVISGEYSLDISLDGVEFCLFLDKDVALAEILEGMGLPVWNTPQSIATCDNKLLMTRALQGLPMMDTYFAPLSFYPTDLEEYHHKIIEKLGLPLVIKEAYGSFGEQVYLAESPEDVNTISNKIGIKPYLYQRYLKASAGQDLRVYVVGDRCVGAMKRVNSGDFRANLSIGGGSFPHNLTKEEELLAISCQKQLGTLFSGVDLMWDQEGNPLVCEVNASAHILNYYQFSGENIAVEILSEIKNRL